MINNINNNKVLLIVLPPCTTRFPLAGATAISSYLNRFGFKTHIWYLNLALQQNKLFNDITTISSINQQLVLLYLYNKYVINDETMSKAVKNEIIDRQICSKHEFKKYIDNIFYYIESEIRKILNAKFLAIGFSSKYNQWIGVALCNKIIKKIYPNQYVFMGAQNTYSESVNMFHLVPDIDATSWGEGELSTLALMRQLQKYGYIKYPISHIIQKENASIQNENSNESRKSFNNLLDTEYVNFLEHNFFLYDDYLLQKINHQDVILPIEKSRGCNWNQCSFCILSQGYKYREKSTQMIVEELYYYIQKYNLYRFQFFDNNFVGSDIAEFEKMLDELIMLRKTYPLFEIHFAEIITIKLNSKLINKMKLAGIKNVQIGFEALSPLILNKFNKQQTLAQNLFFLREALSQGIIPIGNNLIINYVDETKTDIEDSIKNIPYLRFMLRNKCFSIQTPDLMVANYSHYMKMIRKNKIENKYSKNYIYQLISTTKLETQFDRFSIFQFTSINNPLSSNWKNLFTLIQQYKLDEYEYYIENNPNNSQYTYKETKHGKLIKSYTLSYLEIEVLKRLNYSRLTLSDLMKSIGYKNSEELFINQVLKNLIALNIVFYSKIDKDVASIVRI